MVLCLGCSPNADRALLGWSQGQQEPQYRSPEQAEPSCPLGPFHDGWSKELAWYCYRKTGWVTPTGGAPTHPCQMGMAKPGQSPARRQPCLVSSSAATAARAQGGSEIESSPSAPL